MKAIPALLSAAAMLMLASCVSPIAKRIERNPDIYNNLSARHKTMVTQGQIEEGMSKQAVFIAWGRPDRAAKGSRSGRSFEQWSYVAYETVPAMSVGPGFGYWGGYGAHRFSYDPVFFYEPAFTYLPYESARVEFSNAKVTAWKKW